MKVGLQLPLATGQQVARLVEMGWVAEQAGFASVWMVGRPNGAVPSLDLPTALGFLAARTDRIRLGARLEGFATPERLVSTSVTLDVLSGGRGWMWVGLPGGDRPGESSDQVEEALGLARERWS
ncbi:MAG: LLM class flavin-dependent oxidoreductase, partial [Acidimicrobiia bacterium]